MSESQILASLLSGHQELTPLGSEARAATQNKELGNGESCQDQH